MLTVSPKDLTTFRMAPELMEAMRALRERDGVPVSEQVDRAVRAWLLARGVEVKKKKAERKRVAPRSRS